jgi:hypothetical protein
MSTAPLPRWLLRKVFFVALPIPGWLSKMYSLVCARDYNQLEDWADEELSKHTATLKLAHIRHQKKQVSLMLQDLKQPSEWDAIRPQQDDRLTDKEIELAREFPMDSLVISDNGKILCPFHADTNCSMHVYPNGVHCFVCGKHLDVIAWVMYSENLSFYQAVKRLQS